MVLKGTPHALCYSLLLMIMGSVCGSHSLAPECFRRSVSWFWVLWTSVLSFGVFCIIISLPRPSVCLCVLFPSSVPLLVCRSTLPPIYFSQAVMSLLALCLVSVNSFCVPLVISSCYLQNPFCFPESAFLSVPVSCWELVCVLVFPVLF